MSIVVFPGSFDPITVGHVDAIERVAPIFDEVYVLLLVNPEKSIPRFSVEQRVDLITDAVSHLSNVKVAYSDGLLVDYCRSIGASCIVRGIRNGNDVSYEAMLEAVNNRIASSIVTMYVLSKPEYAHISSSLVRQLMDIGIGIEGLVPNADHICFRKDK